MKKLVEKLETLKKEYAHIYVFGAGYYANCFLDFYGMEVVSKFINAFVVSAVENNPAKIGEVPVCLIDEIEKDGVVIVAIAKNKREEIVRFLNIKGFNNIVYIDEVIYVSFLQAGGQKNREEEVLKYISCVKNEKQIFKYIEIETINRCNGECHFCPVNRNEIQRPLHIMTEELYKKIIDELSCLEYKGKVALFSNNEPFLDKRIIEFAKYAREKLPFAFLYIATNGTLLNENNFMEIMSYIDKMVIDVYGTEEIPQNISRISSIASLHGWEDKVQIHQISKTLIRSSRGGESPNSKVDFTINDTCPLPFVQMVVRPDGNVSLCCNDALGKMTLGNAENDSLVDIWNGDRYESVRENILQGRKNVSICKYCDFVDMREL